MIRSIVLLAMLTLVIGCNKGKAPKPDRPSNTGDAVPGGSETGLGVPKPAVETTATGIPLIRPRTTFKLPGQLDSSLKLNPALRVSADGRTFAVRTDNKDICVYDISGVPKLIGQYRGSEFALSPSGKYLFTVESILKYTVTDLASQQMVGKAGLKTKIHGCTACFFRDDNTIVYLLPYNHKPPKGAIVLWDYAKDEQSLFEIPDSRYSHAFLMSGGNELWMVTNQYEQRKFEIDCYDLTKMKLARTIKPSTREYRNVTVATDGSVFASGNERASIFDASTGKVVGGLPETVFAHNTGLLPPNGRFFVGMVGLKGSRGGKVGEPGEYLLYDWKADRLAAILTGHDSTSMPTAIGTPDGRTLISVSRFGQVLMYDLSFVQ